MDAVRAFAMLWGIVFHAACSFVPSWPWIVEDNSSSVTLLLFVSATHISRMPLFFFLAGYFAHLTYHRRGPGHFIQDRLRRIALPWLLFWPPTLGFLYAAGTWEPSVVRAIDPAHLSLETAPLVHLWFLYYLLLVYVIAIAAREGVAIVDRSGAFRARTDEWIDYLLQRHLAPMVFALPLVLAALLNPDWNPGYGLPAPATLVPEIAPLLGYGAAFTIGWIFHRHVGWLTATSRRIAVNCAWALAFLIVGWVAGWIVSGGSSPWTTALRIVGAVAATAYAWNLSFAVIGYALRTFSQPSASVRYMADASYWLYISHLPLVIILQIWVSRWPLGWTIKLLLILAIATPLLLLSYRQLVRPTWLGKMLNGRRHPSLQPFAE